MRKLMALAGGAVMAAALLTGQPATSDEQRASDKPGTCEEHIIPVALAKGKPATERIAATLCTPDSWASGKRQVDVLVAGAIYNRAYWDWPQNPDLYSYVNKTLESGRATLNYARLGTKGSSRPSSLQVTVDTDGYVLHQVVNWIRQRDYDTVNAIGHSLGSITVTNEAARWDDLDKVIVTGMLHLPAVGLNAVPFYLGVHSVATDPQFRGKGYDPGYLTTVPGRRGPSFYDPKHADSKVIEYDEKIKDISTAGELQAVLELVTPSVVNRTRKITEPVLVVMGETDNIFCGLLVNCSSPKSIRANESTYYANAEKLNVRTVPNTAHNLTLHPTADRSYAMINDWISTN